MKSSRPNFRPGYDLLESRTVLSPVGAAAGRLLDVNMITRRSAIISRFAASGLVPIDQMGPGTSYQGEDGGLYGGGSNEPPLGLLDSALAAAGTVVPRSPTGAASNPGRIGVIAIGQSTTKQWFPFFQRMARGLPGSLAFVNAGQDNMVSQNWARSGEPWRVADAMVARSGLSRFQVQVAFIDSARIRSWTDGGLPQQVQAYRADLGRIVSVAKSRYPNLSLVYFLPFHDTQFTRTRRMLQEPYTYQLGFGIRQLVLERGAGSPTLLWGPYVWAAMSNPAFYYDGIHFKTSGRQEMASLMWNFLQRDPVAQRWMANA